MKQPIAIFSSLILTSVLYAHEGNNHGNGVGAVITTAIVTGSEGHKYVTVPGWGVPKNRKNIGSLHGDLAVDQFGNVYAATNSEPGIAVFDCFGDFTKSLKVVLSGMHSLTTVTEGDQQFIWGAQVR